MELTVNPVDRLQGRFRVPGDKSISHRAAMLGAIANGPTTIHGFLRAGDCLSTLQCLRALGVTIEETPDGIVVHGSGPRLRAPAAPLDAGNSGTTMRLLAGILAGQPFVADLTGDASLRSRPMDRIIEPLARMGAQVHALGGERFPPLRIAGGKLRGITYTLPVASAQVKSAVLLAGLYAEGDTTVVEHVVTRDHTERMLEGFGCRIQRVGSRITVTPSTLSSRNVTVPGDISSAAFLLAAAAARHAAARKPSCSGAQSRPPLGAARPYHAAPAPGAHAHAEAVRALATLHRWLIGPFHGVFPAAEKRAITTFNSPPCQPQS